MSMTQQDHVFAHNVAQAKVQANSFATNSLKGWLYIILPLTLCLVTMLVYGLQEVTGIQAYSLLTAPRDMQGNPIPQTGYNAMLARIVLGLIAVGAAAFLVKMWNKQHGAAGFLVGGKKLKNGVFDTQAAALRDSIQDGTMANIAMEQAKESYNQIRRDQNAQMIAGPGASRPPPRYMPPTGSGSPPPFTFPSMSPSAGPGPSGPAPEYPEVINPVRVLHDAIRA